jgi:hypothetical protein
VVGELLAGRTNVNVLVSHIAEVLLAEASFGSMPPIQCGRAVWQSKAAFEAWTKSEEFRAAHARAGNDATGPLYLEHPKFEGFEVRQTVTPKAAVA